jgi:hypothetical protein
MSLDTYFATVAQIFPTLMIAVVIEFTTVMRLSIQHDALEGYDVTRTHLRSFSRIWMWLVVIPFAVGESQSLLELTGKGPGWVNATLVVVTLLSLCLLATGLLMMPMLRIRWFAEARAATRPPEILGDEDA